MGEDSSGLGDAAGLSWNQFGGAQLCCWQENSTWQPRPRNQERTLPRRLFPGASEEWPRGEGARAGSALGWGGNLAWLGF